MSPDRQKYLALLGERFPTKQSLYTEIINLNAILNLPKGTEHFISDLHGEYEAFLHIMNNCSGVIREKVRLVLGDELSPQETNEFCTLLYYPREKLEYLRSHGLATHEWYRPTLDRLIRVARQLSSKYTRSKVRKAMPSSYAYILDELLHAQPDEDANQLAYHQSIIDTLIDIGSARHFILALCQLIKRLAVDRLHVLGDVFDRGGRPDAILDALMEYPNVDFTWGNHDALWMGAAAGNPACVAAVVCNSLSYGHARLLERGYGVSLRLLWMKAAALYPQIAPEEAALRLMTTLMFKLEGQIVSRHPEYEMNDHLLMERVNWAKKTVEWDGKTIPLKAWTFPTVDAEAPYAVTADENRLMLDLIASFKASQRLQKQIRFLYERGGMYRRINGNLLFHGCIPLTEDGMLREVSLHSGAFCGMALMDECDRLAREAFNSRTPDAVDFMWYLWCGASSPLCGRHVHTFLRHLTDETPKEPQDPYYRWNRQRSACEALLHGFGLSASEGRIINGHTPVVMGESPIRGEGKLLVIDGGLCKAYQHVTGIAGYTLIANSHGMRVVAHQPFIHPDEAVKGNADIISNDAEFLAFTKRQMVADTDDGKVIRERIGDLSELLALYRAHSGGV
ncbi:MAG: fructose-1,6-bisphosphatase [Eubacteriales bacterium]|nr:fructose-1,6-bisphosphatase [Eubacteriales bacterium]